MAALAAIKMKYLRPLAEERFEERGMQRDSSAQQPGHSTRDEVANERETSGEKNICVYLRFSAKVFECDLS